VGREADQAGAEARTRLGAAIAKHPSAGCSRVPRANDEGRSDEAPSGTSLLIPVVPEEGVVNPGRASRGYGVRQSGRRGLRGATRLPGAKRQGAQEDPLPFGTRGGGRTHTSLTGHGILSPARLPIPPLWHQTAEGILRPAADSVNDTSTVREDPEWVRTLLRRPGRGPRRRVGRQRGSRSASRGSRGGRRGSTSRSP
jgi:hypothetical protein